MSSEASSEVSSEDLNERQEDNKKPEDQNGHLDSSEAVTSNGTSSSVEPNNKVGLYLYLSVLSRLSLLGLSFLSFFMHSV